VKRAALVACDRCHREQEFDRDQSGDLPVELVRESFVCYWPAAVAPWVDPYLHPAAPHPETICLACLTASERQELLYRTKFVDATWTAAKTR
jgi:hypothetical protein